MPELPEYCTVDGWAPTGTSPLHLSVVNPRLNLPGWVLVQDTDFHKKGEYKFTMRYHNTEAWQAWREPVTLAEEWRNSEKSWYTTHQMYHRFGIDILMMFRSDEPVDAPTEPGDSEEES